VTGFPRPHDSSDLTSSALLRSDKSPLPERATQHSVATNFQEEAPKGATTLEREYELLWKMLADKDDVIADLREQLDAEAEERRKLTLILTDKQHEVKEPKNKGFWQWIFQ
jgi:hypothetical protein